MLIRELSALECMRILTANRVGRLACAKDGQPYVVPFYYAHSDAHLYGFAMRAKRSNGCGPILWCASRSTNMARGEDGKASLPRAATKKCLTGSATSFSGIMPGRC